MKQSNALRGTSPLRLLSRPSVLGIATLLCGIATTLPVQALTLDKFDRVYDAFPPNDHGAYGGGTVFDWMSSGLAPSQASGTTVTFSAYDRPGAPHGSHLYQDNRIVTQPYATQGAPIATLSTLEGGYSTGWNHGTNAGGALANVATSANTIGTGNVNSFCVYREFRISYGNAAIFQGPTELIYSNIDESNLALHTQLPSTTDVVSGQTDIGFEGYATPRDSAAGIYRVFLCLRRDSDGKFWSGSAWTDRREKFLANLAPDPNSGIGRVHWTKVGGWPAGTNLPAGNYTLRTLAQEGGQSGPGLQSTITFKISVLTFPPKGSATVASTDSSKGS